MGNQTKSNNSVESFHGKAKNAVNKGFLEAFEVSQGSESLDSSNRVVLNLGRGKDQKDQAHGSEAVKAVKKEGLTLIEPFLTQIISINYRKEQS